LVVNQRWQTAVVLASVGDEASRRSAETPYDVYPTCIRLPVDSDDAWNSRGSFDF